MNVQYHRNFTINIYIQYAMINNKYMYKMSMH